MITMATRVQRGTELLDLRVQGWRDMIEWDRLDMQSPLHCILGQITGRYVRGEHSLQIDGQPYGFITQKQTEQKPLQLLWEEVGREAVCHGS